MHWPKKPGRKPGRMTDIFLRCTKMEWLFWDSAWHLESWKYKSVNSSKCANNLINKINYEKNTISGP